MNEKLKNLKDLEYSNILNKQNIILVFIGTSIISLFFTDKLPPQFSKTVLFLFLVLIGLFFLIYFNYRLSKVEEEIKNI